VEKKFEVDAQTFIGGWYMSEEICDQILDLYNNNKSLHEPGVVGTDIINEDGKVTSRPHIDAEAKKCTQLRVLKNAQQLSLYNIHLQAILDSYKQKYEWADQVKYYKIVEDMSIQHYKPGEGFYRWHMENTGHGFTINRHLVFMTYLNDVENAGTEFLYFPDLKIQARKGLTLIWPAGWTHTHRGVVSDVDEKYIITGWYSFYDK
tara:strand:- start:1039 stop:1653 length:615 start_codon:yes stop_codon:yes gene_type:complete